MLGNSPLSSPGALSPKGNLSPAAMRPHPPFPQPPPTATRSLDWPSLNWPSGRSRQWSHTARCHGAWLFSLSVLSKCTHVAPLSFSYWLVVRLVDTPFCAPVYLLMYLWVISTFWLL